MTPTQKAAATRKRRAAAAKAAHTKKRRVAGDKAARTRKRHSAARKADATRKARAKEIVIDHAAVMNSCNEKAWKKGLSSLNEVERIVHFVNVANCEIEMGTMLQFFYNSAGDHAAETVPALEAVGATRAAAGLRAALKKFPGVSSPAESEKRYAGWHGVSGSLDKYTSEFYKQKPDVFSLLCSFIDKHAAALRRHERGA